MMPSACVAVGLLCCLAGVDCSGDGAATPSVATIQAAYDEAKSEVGARHDDQLVIQDADCHDDGPHKFTCQVGFTDVRSVDGRLYFDVIELDREARGWRLVSGLCRG
jgi:hypothetical protein